MSETAGKPKTKTKPYNGYKSFSYLEPGVDYKPFKLAKEIGRVEPFTYPVSEEEEALVQTILEEEMIISLHEHTFVCPENVYEIFEFRRQGRDWTGYEGLSVSGLDVVFENFMDGTALITSNAGWKWTDIIHDLGIRYSDFAHQDLIIRAETVDDLYRAKREGKIALGVMPGGRDSDRKRDRPGGRAVRIRRAGDGDRLFGSQCPRFRPEGKK